jgi:F0F1-type ATP synthase membrane subunit b/b'
MSEAWLIKIFQANLFVFAILIAFYIHYKPYEGILGKRSNAIKALEMVCADFKCKTDMINSL